MGWPREPSPGHGPGCSLAGQVRLPASSFMSVTTASCFNCPTRCPARNCYPWWEAQRIESLLRTRLEGSGFFGARFRECAGRALLLPRAKFNERMPLWLSRLRSQKLLDAVLQYDDFPILLETGEPACRTSLIWKA